MTTTQFFINDDGIRLNTELAVPDNATSLVIIIHGLTGNMEEKHLVAVSDSLNSIGLATLRVDMYGHGNSDGDFADHTLFKWIGNALAVIDYARNLDFVKNIYLCGHSQGGMLVMLAGALKHDVISGLILLAPAAMIPEICRKGEMVGIQFDPNHVPDSISCWGRELDGNYIRTAQMISAEDAIERFNGPVLVVHGDADESVPVDVGIDVARQYKQGGIVVIPGDDHGFGKHLDQMTETVSEWMSGMIKKERKTTL